jgi:predicted DNA-binding ribbon-helix-helix protein
MSSTMPFSGRRLTAPFLWDESSEKALASGAVPHMPCGILPHAGSAALIYRRSPNKTRNFAEDQMIGSANLSDAYGVDGSPSRNLACPSRRKAMKSATITRSIVVGGQKARFTLEEPVWAGLKEIANHDHETLSRLVAKIDAERRNSNLSSALRMFVLDYIRAHDENRIPSQDSHDDGPSMWTTAVVSNRKRREDGDQIAAFKGASAKKG